MGKVIDYTIGFTGTRKGMDASQLETFTRLMLEVKKWCAEKKMRPVFRHGDCIGADDQAATTASILGFYVIAHPCILSEQRAYNPNSNEVMIPKDPLVRNRDIVDKSDYMFCVPKEAVTEQEPLRSGTWATIRYARKQRKGRFAIIYP
jgi:hypothetical protein